MIMLDIDINDIQSFVDEITRSHCLDIKHKLQLEIFINRMWRMQNVLKADATARLAKDTIERFQSRGHVRCKKFIIGSREYEV
mmetsp:Transcript_43448/g.69930  ORF Transcript_43448/g.69930 Transcript_43448/m.69930 type:complete len:83 (+) Transcript_43448:383-631(+)